MLRVALLHPTFQPSALALAILAASVPLAYAEDTQLQTVIVQAEQADDDALPTRPPASIYGGLESKVLDTPRSVTQINAEQLARDPIQSSDDLVKYAPGITRGMTVVDPSFRLGTPPVTVVEAAKLDRLKALYTRSIGGR